MKIALKAFAALVVVFSTVVGPASTSIAQFIGFNFWGANATAGSRYYRLIMDSKMTSDGSVRIQELELQWNNTWQANAMTSDSAGTIGGVPITLTESSVYLTNIASLAFDGSTGGGPYISGAGTYSSSPPYDDASAPSEYVEIDFGSGNQKVITGIRFLSSIYGPDVFHLEKSEDHTTWTTVTGSSKTHGTNGDEAFTWGSGASVPPNPTGQSAAAISESQIDLNWTSGGGTTASYKIAYVTGATPPTDCGSASVFNVAAATATPVYSLTPSTQYSFRICGVNADKVTSPGVTATATTMTPAPPPDPSSPSATPTELADVSLSWTSGGGSTNNFIVAYQSGGTAPANCSSGTTVSVNPSNAVITGLAIATQYSFRICAANSVAVLSSGITISATTNSGPTGGFRYYRFVTTSVDGPQTYEVLHNVQLRWNTYWATNAMTSNSTGRVGGCSASTSASGGAANAFYVFDAVFDAFISASGGFSATAPYDMTASGEWVEIDFGAGNAPQVTGMKVYGWPAPGNYVPDAYHLEGSNDNSSWTTIIGSSQAAVAYPEQTFTWSWSN